MIKAKFICNNIADYTWSGGGTSREVFFRAVSGNSEENKSFSKATPSGELKMVIDKDTLAYDYFKPGKSYYLTIEEAAD